MQDARTRRTVIVLLLATFSLALWVPDIRRVFGHPLGVFGFTTSVTNRVVDLDPDSPAAKAGVRNGFLLDYARMTPHDRLLTVWGETLNPGETVHVALLSARDERIDARFPSVREPPRNLSVILLRFILALMTLLAGILVVLRRPGIATWAFFIFCLVAGGPVNVSTLVGPHWFQTIAIAVFWVALSISSMAAVIFAVYLLHDGTLRGWRKYLVSATVALALVSCAMQAWRIAALTLYGMSTPAFTFIQFGIVILSIDAVPIVLLATYLESGPAVRERLRWVAAGFVVNAVARTVDAFGGNGEVALFPISYAAHSVLILIATLAVTLPVMYAILKHRIIDINVAISRAVVYTVLSAIVVGLFAVVDLFFSRVLAQSKAGFIADIALALVLGFFFNGLHGHVDRFVDGLLFRTRHRAEQHLATVTAAIPYVKSEDHVDRLLTEEPVRAFDLCGAHIARVDRISTPNLASLVAYLEAERHVLRLGEHEFHGRDFTEFEAAVAAPMFCHGELTAIVFYGFHRNGTDLDGEEVAILERLAEAAGAAYDHLEAQALRREVESLRSQLATMTAR